MEPHPGRANSEMVQAWRKVFRSDNPIEGYPTTLAFQYPFQPAIDEMMFLAPTAGYYLTRRHYAALQDALAAVEESMFYTYTYEGEAPGAGGIAVSTNARGDPVHFKLKRGDSYEDYKKAVPWPLENTLYSSSGTWGLIVSHEEHGILGGSRRFIDVFKSHYQLWRADLADLKHYWADSPNRAWLDALLPRVVEGLTVEAAPYPDDDE